jgi:hypothetical protein
MSTNECHKVSINCRRFVLLNAAIFILVLTKGMYNGDILAVPRRINAEVEERER